MQNIAQIIPHRKLPRGMNFFDYIVPEALINKIKVGDLVEVPWKTKAMVGVVNGFIKESKFEHLKEIVGVKEYQLPKYQADLLRWFAEFYHHSAGSMLKIFLPDQPKRTVKVKPVKTVASSDLKNITINADVKKLAEHIFCSSDRKFLLSPFSPDAKVALFVQLCYTAIKKNKQVLILFPQKEKISEFESHLPAELRKETVVLTNELYTSKTRYFNIWSEINGGTKHIILGARSAIFAPLNNLGAIVIDDAHSVDYKQYDQAPRYQTLTVAKKIQELTGCKLIVSSLTPRVEDYHSAQKEHYKLISLGKPAESKIRIINLADERKNKFTYLSERLLESVEETLEKQKKVVLIVNKKGLYSYLFCQDCGYEANCKECGLPLAVENEKELACHHCQIKQPIFLQCPSCHGVNLKKLGVGIEGIEEQLKSKFGTQSKNILVTTGQGLSQDVWQGVGLLGFVYIDSLVYLADFNSNFKLYSFVSELIQRSRVPEIILQTAFPQNLAFQNLNKRYVDFYKEEMDGRKMFGYPPFNTLIKIFLQHHDLKICEREAKDLFRKLKPIVETARGKIADPYLHYIQKVRKRYRYQIVLFLPGLTMDEETRIIGGVPEFWSIDKEPVDLL